MKTAKENLHPLLERMSRITRMERGKICSMGERPYYNHQIWEGKRNVVRYVPTKRLESLQEAINGYQLFMQLAHEYAEEVIASTRQAEKDV